MTYLGARIKYLRKQDGITQMQLATALKISKSTISMYENGQREPDFETLESLADYFNVDMRTFFPGGEAPSLVPSSTREIMDMLSDMTPEELALVAARIRKIKESR